MRVAVLSESPADEAAIRVLARGLLSAQVEATSGPPLRSRGWPSVRDVLPVVLRHLHYQTDATGLIVVVDADGPVVHRQGIPSPCSPGCRACELRVVLAREQQRLRAVPGRAALQFAVGLAVPAIEAWYRVGIDARVSEATWVQGYQSSPPRPPYTKASLKRAVYGTERPHQALQIQRATEEAERLLQCLDDLTILFPGGFASLAIDLSAWSVRSG